MEEWFILVKDKSIKVNAVLNMIKTLSSIIFPLITFPYVSRVLMPENIGKINFGLSFVNYFSLIASLGITTYAIRECSAKRENKDDLSKIASQIFSINITTTIVAYVLLTITLLIFRDFDSYRTLIIIQSTVILFTTLGCDWLNSSMEDFAYITIRSFTFNFLSLILMFLYVKVPEDYLKYAFITVISSSGANLSNVFYRRKYCNVRFTIKMKWNAHFTPILLLFVMILAQTIFSNSDITMLGLMKGDFEVGIYSTAIKVEIIIAQVVSSLAWVVMPRMSAYFAEDQYEKINFLLKKVLGLLLLIGLPSIAGVVSLSNEIVLIIGGQEYAKAALPLSILMGAFLFSLLGGSFLGNMVLLPSKNERTYMIICCVTAIVNVILNYVLIPMGGASAAALTTTISSLLMMVLLLKSRDKRVKLDYLKDVGTSPFIGSVIIYIFCVMIKSIVRDLWMCTIIGVIGSVLIYTAIVFLLKNSLCMDIVSSIANRLNGKAK